MTPTIIDYDTQKNYFVVSVAKQGERLSTIVGDNSPRISLEYLYEYGQTLAKLHQQEGKFEEVKDRRFFHIPDKQYFSELELEFVHEYLISSQPQMIEQEE